MDYFTEEIHVTTDGQVHFSTVEGVDYRTEAEARLFLEAFPVPVPDQTGETVVRTDLYPFGVRAHDGTVLAKVRGKHATPAERALIGQQVVRTGKDKGKTLAEIHGAEQFEVKG